MTSLAQRMKDALEQRRQAGASEAKPVATQEFKKPTDHKLTTPLEAKPAPTIAAPGQTGLFRSAPVRPVIRPPEQNAQQATASQPSVTPSKPMASIHRAEAVTQSEGPRPAVRLAANVTAANARASAAGKEQQDKVAARQASIAHNLQKIANAAEKHQQQTQQTPKISR